MADPRPRAGPRWLHALIEDCREIPATIAICAVWIALFVLLIGLDVQGGHPPSLGRLVSRGLTVANSHRLGDMTLGEIFQGESWRALTCTFIHYNLLHIGMNVYGMYQLGGLVESWYGSGPFLAFYVLIGGGGNLISAEIRRALGWSLRTHSGGGSTVILGLVGFCAVCGWRARTRVGDYLRNQMVIVLALTALIGYLLPIIDNWGHAGGALVGAAFGLAHRPVSRLAKSSAARWAGAVALAVIVGCAVLQGRDDRAETPQRAEERWNDRLRTLATLEQVRVELLRADRNGDRLRGAARLLDACRDDLDRDATAPDFRALYRLIETRSGGPWSSEDGRAAEARVKHLIARVLLQRDAARQEYLALRRRGAT